jgi:hypothetical protein
LPLKANRPHGAIMRNMPRQFDGYYGGVVAWAFSPNRASSALDLSLDPGRPPSVAAIPTVIAGT